MTLADQALDALLKRLHLANTRRAWRDLAQRAEQEEWTYRALLALVVSEESAQRPQTRIARLVRRARVPFLKTVDDFNVLHQSTVRLALLGSALASEFVTEGRCVILRGKPGRGKTPLAVAIAYRAISDRLRRALRDGGRADRRPGRRLSPGPSGRGARAVRPAQRPRRRRSGLPHRRDRRRQHALPRRQRPTSEEARHGLHDEHGALGMGPRPA